MGLSAVWVTLKSVHVSCMLTEERQFQGHFVFMFCSKLIIAACKHFRFCGIWLFIEWRGNGWWSCVNVFRDLLHRKLLKEDARLERQYGIPQHYGLLYAIGVALIMEGIMSACYHVCPNYSNFQFGQTSLFSVPDAIVLCSRHCSLYQMP